jgi:putative transposase
MIEIVTDGKGKQSSENRVALSLDELAREGARRMIAEALLAEVEEFIQRHAGERDEQGRRLIVRNGQAKARNVTLGAGTVELRAPRVEVRQEGADRGIQPFSSKILPRYARRSPAVDDVLPVLYLRGLSTGDFQPALESLLGEKAQGLSATTITRLKGSWEEEYRTFRKRDLSQQRYAYLWVDGVHFRIRLEEDRLSALVVIGVRANGTKELLAIEDGYRESTEPWKSVLRDLRERGLQAPMLAIGDGALGFWAALREVFPSTREQRCWLHKLWNVLDKLPKRLQPKAKRALHEIMESATREDAEKAMEAFRREHEAKYPKAVECLLKDADSLLAFFDFPAEHWRHIRTTNAIESVFATVRLRTRVTKGAGSRKAGLMMAYKLMDAASGRWRALHGAHLVKSVLDGETFKDGILQTSAARRDAA